MTSDWSSRKKAAYHWRSRRVELENGADSYQWRLRDAGPLLWRKQNEFAGKRMKRWRKIEAEDFLTFRCS